MNIWHTVTIGDCERTILDAKARGNDVSAWVWTAPDCPFPDRTFLGYPVIVDPDCKSIGFGPRRKEKP